MKGLQLSEIYYKEVGKPWLDQCFPEYRDRICAGLVGQGSECFGFDDEDIFTVDDLIHNLADGSVLSDSDSEDEHELAPKIRAGILRDKLK